METSLLSPVVFLSGKIVNLCLLNADIHLNDCVLWLNNYELTRYLSTGFLPQYPQEEKGWFEKNAQVNSNKVILAMHLKTDNKFIGIMGLHNINYIHRTAISGSFIGEEVNRGKGYGHDAKMILLNYAFNRLNLRKICASAIAFNERSISFNQGCGYKIEGRLKKQIFANGEYYDEALLAVFADTFKPLWEKYCKQ